MPAKPAPSHVGCARHVTRPQDPRPDRLDCMEGVSQQQILELATCQFIEQPEDVGLITLVNRMLSIRIPV